MLNLLAEVSYKINKRIGRIWYKEYINKEYGNVDFEKVETIYQDARDIAVNLLDTQNIANKLTALIGHRSRKHFPYKNVLGVIAAAIVILSLLFCDNILVRFLVRKKSLTQYLLTLITHHLILLLLQKFYKFQRKKITHLQKSPPIELSKLSHRRRKL